jgi:hypothetical protein
MQVVSRPPIAVDSIRPLLLQGDSEYRHAAGFASHHIQKIANVRTYLNIVGQMKMRVIEFEVVRLGVRRRSANKQEHSDRGNK